MTKSSRGLSILARAPVATGVRTKHEKPSKRIIMKTKYRTNAPGRILRHGQPSGEITEEAILQRAKELALIDGRTGETVTETDRERGLAELRGKHLPPAAADEETPVPERLRDPSELPLSQGHRTPEQPRSEDDAAAERLALEGVEEAQHDQMLAARQARLKGA